MKKIKAIGWTFLGAIILLLIFLAAKIFFNQNNSSYTKIIWEKAAKEELQDNLILAPAEPDNPKQDNYSAEADKPVEKAVEKFSPDSLAIKNHLVKWGFTPSIQRTVDTIIIHSSYDALSGNPYSLEGLIKEYQQYGVAPHYLLDRQGIIYQLVEEKNVAYHAGTSQTPDGRKNVNAFSVGIEIMNTQTDSPTDEQYASLQKLIDFLKGSYKIKYVLGHSQIAQGRKDDPWNFDWKKITK